MRLLTLAIAAVVLMSAGFADAQQKRLYRWTDKDGKVHYSDHVPPEAIENARSEINQRGLKVGEVGRALTAEEKAVAAAAQRAAAEQRKLEEDQAKRDNILLSSYGSVAELDRAYAERFDLLEQSLESARAGIRSQEKSLAELLAHAAGLQRQNKKVPDNIRQSIELAQRQVTQQRDYLASREAEKAEVDKEYSETRERYLSLQAEAAQQAAQN
ncbi:DUF4124 domain-containing protein [Pseudomarimonas salicorniae]|uniref:DUF4124 domain-containing protein n=1 Tax=Pseudomarimonas salicorniae TaxID=2933270 RepID=A0ABT0GDC0_9GAMM|nr:DUF4124 domain-containing protein [Lysobacter sp. CAU 1642]MCK7592539.1 DUF4124 domain-containing protein [Lysobacter sp. CAU 1642]